MAELLGAAARRLDCGDPAQQVCCPSQLFCVPHCAAQLALLSDLRAAFPRLDTFQAGLVLQVTYYNNISL